jgi:diadenosine tetraphosphatase ApaH/serine/threonine PP2A family protein phosphatase
VRVALLSDVHANLSALEAILEHAASPGYDAVWVAGDLVGYGPDPDAVVERLDEAGALAVMGNHDAATLGMLPLKQFNDLAAAAVRWTQEHTTEATREYLARLPRVRYEGDFTIVHGTLRDPLWEYMSSRDAAEAHLRLQQTPFSAVGHTHYQLLAWLDGKSVDSHTPADGEECPLGEGPLVVNPGGAGQPRDRDVRVAYAMLDLEARSVRFLRVPYDIAATQERMRQAGLPELLAARLAVGR